tara:strand:+ start:16587 stop:17801 length:1215 start_codon:yes stop_codon:yes gene_type:complete
MIKADKEKLVVEIDNDQINYAVFILNEKLNYEILFKKNSKNAGLDKGKISNFIEAKNKINDDLEEIEKKTGKIFENIFVIINQTEISSTNFTVFKKLGGSKVEKRDIEYILNEAKNSVANNQKSNSILHILNSNYILDKTAQEGPPLNVFGDQLGLHTTFISVPKNNLKNIYSLFENCDLKVQRVISKQFVFGIDFLKKNNHLKNFLIVNFEKQLTNVSLYDSSSLVSLRIIPFGTNSIYNDVAQLCSLKINEIDNLFNEINFNSSLDKEKSYIEKKFFTETEYKKLTLSFVKDIVNARIKEMTNYSINMNKEASFMLDKISKIYVFFQDESIYKNLGELFNKNLINFSNKSGIELMSNNDFSALSGAAELIFKGWHREAIPLTVKKRSMISSFFSRFFRKHTL